MALPIVNHFSRDASFFVFIKTIRCLCGDKCSRWFQICRPRLVLSFSVVWAMQFSCVLVSKPRCRSGRVPYCRAHGCVGGLSTRRPPLFLRLLNHPAISSPQLRLETRASNVASSRTPRTATVQLNETTGERNRWPLANY